MGNSTVLTCTTSYAELINTASLHSSAPFSVTVHGYTATLSTFACAGGTGGSTCDNPKEAAMGSYAAPGFQVNKGTGDTPINQDASMNISDVNILAGAFTFPLLANVSVPLVVSSDDIAVSVFGIKTGNLKLRQGLMCTLIAQDGEPPNPKLCDGGDAGGIGVIMTCTHGLDKNFTTGVDKTFADAIVI